MNYVYLGKETVETMEDVHRLFQEAFSFPDYYGKNLDALYDCLSEVAEPSLVLLSDADVLRSRLGEKYETLLLVLNDSLENPNLHLREFEETELL